MSSKTGLSWKSYSVMDLQKKGLLFVEDGNHGENRPRRDEFTESGIPFIRAADLSDGGICFETASKINDIALQRVRKGLAKACDVILSHKGTVGKVALAPPHAPNFVCSPQTTLWRSLDHNAIDYRFLYYYLKSDSFTRQLDAVKGETDMADYVSLTAQRRMSIHVPDIREQQAIAHVLGSLDDQIKLNRRMNRTLEAIARAIFKSWFIDFEPIPKFGPHKEWKDSVLGTIPKGWTCRSVYECATYVNGAAYTVSHFTPDNSGLPVIKIAELKNGITAQTKFSKVNLGSKSLIDTGDILFSWSGSPDTSIDTFLWDGGPAFLNQHIFKVVPDGEKRSFVFLLLKYLKATFVEIARNKQTTGLGHVTVRDLTELPLACPPPPVLRAFQQFIDPLVDRILANLTETKVLARIRDTLLPKLLSGEMRIGDPEKLVSQGV